MSYTLPSLPYAYDALEPHFDKQTMEIDRAGPNGVADGG